MVMYSVHQHWDKLKTCIVGRSYPPEFYSYITNSNVRNVMERIAIETEEDYQKLILLLESFNVEVMRPVLKESIEYYKKEDGTYLPPPMTPRDYTAMIGNKMFWNRTSIISKDKLSTYSNIIKNIKNQGNNIVYDKDVNSAMVSRIGKDLYFGTEYNKTISSLKFLNLTKIVKSKIIQNVIQEINMDNINMFLDIGDMAPEHIQYFVDKLKIINTYFKDYRCHIVDTQGHSDAVYCPVVPGLIVSLCDIQKYEKSFPDWEVIYLENQSWDAVQPFLKLKQKNEGKWWVPGEELNDEFTEFVENWLGHWVGYVEESVFDVNMLVIDKKNVVCNNYNKAVFDAFERYGITPHIINFRHRYFWDGGLHCITSDLDREGDQVNYFPEREIK